MRIVAVLAAALVFVAAAAADAPSDGVVLTSVGTVRVTAAGELERLVLGELNRARTERGLPELRSNPTLVAAAREHSLSMAREGFFGHESHDGTPFWQRVRARYAPEGASQWGVGENIAWGSVGLSAARTVEMWLRSTPHRKNLLSAVWREVGIGGVRVPAAPGEYAGLDVTIVTADFGVRK